MIKKAYLKNNFIIGNTRIEDCIIQDVVEEHFFNCTDSLNKSIGTLDLKNKCNILPLIDVTPLEIQKIIKETLNRLLLCDNTLRIRDERKGIVLGTFQGMQLLQESWMEDVDSSPEFLDPMKFSVMSNNAISSLLAMAMGYKAFNTTLLGLSSGIQSIGYGFLQIINDKSDLAVCGAIDIVSCKEQCPKIQTIKSSACIMSIFSENVVDSKSFSTPEIIGYSEMITPNSDEDFLLAIKNLNIELGGNDTVTICTPSKFKPQICKAVSRISCSEKKKPQVIDLTNTICGHSATAGLFSVFFTVDLVAKKLISACKNLHKITGEKTESHLKKGGNALIIHVDSNDCASFIALSFVIVRGTDAKNQKICNKLHWI